MSKKIVLRGEPISRLRASWLLFKESFSFLRADKEMVWIPLITTIMNLVLFGVLVTVFVLATDSKDAFMPNTEEGITPIQYVFIFFAYVIGAFTLALSQAGITHIVYTRIHGGNATLGQGLKQAFSHWFSLLLWSIITSTIGMILRMIIERSRLLGFIVASVLGVAWSLLTYFVVPAMIIDNKSAFASVGKSGQVFKKTWGETIVSNITLGLVFFVAHIFALFAFIGLFITGLMTQLTLFFYIAVVLYVVWLIFASLVGAALAGVIKTLLYVYAAEGVVPQNFDQELLEQMFIHKGKEKTATQTPVASLDTNHANEDISPND